MATPCRAASFLVSLLLVVMSAASAGAQTQTQAQSDPESPLHWVDTKDVPLPEPQPLLWGQAPTARFRRVALDVTVHSAALFPHGQFSRHTRAAVAYGAGLAGRWRFDGRSALRVGATYSRSQFTAKESGLHGPVVLNAVIFRADYVFGHHWWQPWAGASLGVVPWRGDISQPIAQRSNKDSGHPLAGGLAAGVDLYLVPHLALSPELSWAQLGGGFKASMWSAGLALRGRI